MSLLPLSPRLPATPRPSTFCSCRFRSICLLDGFSERDSIQPATQLPSPQRRRRSFRLPPLAQLSEGISDILFWSSKSSDEQNRGWFERLGKRIQIYLRNDLSNGDSFLFASISPQAAQLHPQMHNESLLIQVLRERVFPASANSRSTRLTELRILAMHRKLHRAGCRVPAIYNADSIQYGESSYFLIEKIIRPIRMNWLREIPIRLLYPSEKRLLWELAIMMNTCYQAYLLPHIRPDHIRWSEDNSLTLVHLLPYPGKGKTRDECFQEMIRTFFREGTEACEFLNQALKEENLKRLAKLLGIRRHRLLMPPIQKP